MRKFVMAAVVTGLMAGGIVAPAMAARDKDPKGTTQYWRYSYGSETDPGVSVDGPKSSTAYDINEGGIVQLRGYYDMPLSQFSAKFSYLDADPDGDGSPRVSVELNETFVPDGAVEPVQLAAFLDPFHCAGSVDAKGWSTTNFFRIGSDCAIYLNDGQVFTGTATTSAWSALVAEYGTTQVWNSYVIADQADPGTLIDRVTFGATVLSKFPCASQDTAGYCIVRA